MKFSPRLQRLLEPCAGGISGDSTDVVELVVFGTRRVPRSLECGSTQLVYVGKALAFCVVRVRLSIMRLQQSSMLDDPSIQAADVNAPWVRALLLPRGAVPAVFSKPVNHRRTDRLQAGAIRRWRGKGVRIALLDTGTCPSHWIPEAQLERVDLVDGPDPEDPHSSHATLIAGLLLSTNSQAPGLCPDAMVHDIRIFDAEGSADVRSIMVGLDTAAQLDVDIINCSWGSRMSSPPIRSAIEALAQCGTLLTCAAGNGGAPAAGKTSTVEWPARIEHCNVFSVGSIDASYQLSEFSSRSIEPARHVDLVEHGEQLVSTLPDGMPGGQRGLTTAFAGTSFAAPRVAGCLASLIQAVRGTGVESPRLVASELLRSVCSLDGADGAAAKAATVVVSQ